jgi:NTP pyrophosphatase (non-canonical NTP hydrolase)
MDARLRALEELILECWQTAEEKGFHSTKATTTERLMLIVSEAVEAMEELRAGKSPIAREIIGGKPEGFGSELADIVIRVFDLAMNEKIDLATELLEKMAYNKTRPSLHGKTF